MTRAAGAIGMVLAGVVTLGACDGGPGGSARPVASTALTAETATTLPIAGSTSQLLGEMATVMSGLSAQIAADGDEAATLERIEALWAVAHPDVESERPELVGGMQTSVDLARSAVTRKRPADADKAVNLLTDLTDYYTGDG